ncbi:hypothetical protein J2S66_003260 [Saccharothrix longispora]|uniref:Secreted protein n=1 Tax=Saccharothrix longispora TaxID=33920 RepID=A0ABU1PWQ6_9PSEU|nr:hypothetical protein [Saccharothrix longispora]MDR6594876.1 hypothetical protein [Saccharothrix longispora]
MQAPLMTATWIVVACNQGRARKSRHPCRAASSSAGRGGTCLSGTFSATSAAALIANVAASTAKDTPAPTVSTSNADTTGARSVAAFWAASTRALA